MHTDKNNDEEEIRILRKLSKITKNPRMKLRYNVIRLYLQGYDKRKIAAIFDISYDAVNDYVNSYKANGIGGLTMGKSTGCPRKLTLLQE